MKLILSISLLISLNVFAEDIIINKDTTVNNTWVIPSTTVLRFEGGRILGTGTINGGIINAAYTQHIFDTLLTVNPSAMYNINFSACWFGAKAANTGRQNRVAFQKGINTCKGRFPLFIPRGIYQVDTTLIIDGTPSGVALHLFGESNYWDEGGVGTILQFQNKAQAGILLEYNKGTEINNLNIRGQWTSPTNSTLQAYFARSFAQYRDSTCGQFYFGIEIDKNYNPGGSGSSGINIHDCIIARFTVLISCSLQSWTLNADCILIQNMYLGDCRTMILSTQGQEKGNILRNIYGWGSHYTFFDSGNNNNGQGGGWTIDGFNVIGGNQEFRINQSGWNQVNILNGFMENFYSLGTITTGNNLKITSCEFDFSVPSVAGNTNRVLLNSNGPNVVFDNCLFRFFGEGGAMKFTGSAAYMNCYWQGTYQNDNPGGRYQVTLPSGIRLKL